MNGFYPPRKRILIALHYDSVKMPRINFCLITPYEAEQIRQGIDISCRGHRHVSRVEVLRLTGGGKVRPWLEENNALVKAEQISFNFHPIADWATLPDGKQSSRHVVLRNAREWRSIKGSMQWVAIGGRGRSHGLRYKIKCKPARAPKCKVITNSVRG